MAENIYTQLAQNHESEYTSTVAADASASRDWNDNIGEGLKVTATGIGVVFAVLLIMIIFIYLIKKLEPVLENLFTSEKGQGNTAGSQDTTKGAVKDQNIDNTTLVLISAAVAAYTHHKGKIRSISVLPAKAKQGGNWAMQARSALQSSHNKKY